MDATDSEPVDAQYHGCSVVDLYNRHRAHRSLNLTPPDGRKPTDERDLEMLTVVRRNRLSGLLHEYQRAA